MFELEKNVKNLPEMNDNLKVVTTKINQYQQIAKNSIMAISLILADISEKPNEYLEGSGFTKIADYAEEIFGYKKAYTYKLIKISKFIKLTDNNGVPLSIDYLLNDEKAFELTDNGNILCINVLKDEDGFEYSTSQLLELLPLSDKQIKDNLKELDSMLSCKELRKVVKDIISPPINTTANDVNEENTDENTDENNSEIISITDKDRILQMLEICSNIENEEIKGLIINVFQKALKKLERK